MNFRFFAVKTLFSFETDFGAFDSFLKFLLEDFLEELFSDDEPKVIEIVDRLPVGGVARDETAFVEHGIEFFMERRPNKLAGWTIVVSHNNRRC